MIRVKPHKDVNVTFTPQQAETLHDAALAGRETIETSELRARYFQSAMRRLQEARFPR